MTTPLQTAAPGRPQGPRSFLSDKAVIALCMLVTVMEGYNLIVFGSVVPLLLTDTSLRIDEQTTGLVGGIVYAGALIGVLGGTALADRYGRHRVMALAAAVFAAGSALAALSPTPEFLGMARLITGIGVGGAVTTAMTLARNHAPKQRGSLVITITMAAAVTNMVTWLGLNVWLAESMKTLGFSLTEALIFAFTLTGAAVIGSWFTATAADRAGPAKIGILCAALTLAGLLGILLGPVSIGFALVCVALMGIGGHSTQNLINATATSAVAPHSRGTILGLTNSMAFAGSFLGPVLGGTAFAAGGPAGIFTTYSVSATLCLVLCAALHLAHKPAPRETPVEAEPAPALP
jgi:MFS family permease